MPELPWPPGQMLAHSRLCTNSIPAAPVRPGPAGIMGTGSVGGLAGLVLSGGENKDLPGLQGHPGCWGPTCGTATGWVGGARGPACLGQGRAVSPWGRAGL